MRAALIDYGSGNLASAAKALARAARRHQRPRDRRHRRSRQWCADAERIVLPGVGAFADCMAGPDGRARHGRGADARCVIRNGTPFLGICVGMQLLASVGREFGDHAGLGWIAGEVVQMTPSDPALKIPHMGWNELRPSQDHPLFAGMDAGAPCLFRA